MTRLTVRSSTWRAIGFWLLVWTVIATLRALQTGAQLAYTHQHIDWVRVFGERFLEWYTAGAVTPFYIALVRQLPKYDLPKVALFAIYTLAVIGGFLLKSLLYVPLENAIFHGGASFMNGVAYDLFSEAFGNAAIFAAIIAIEHSRNSQRNELRAAELEAELAETRLQALRFQLDPHFLFNTLNSISALIKDDPRGADEMLCRLSAMLRLSLDSGSTQEVSLESELDFLKRYFEIMGVRFGQRLVARLHVPASLLAERVPGFILQPLIENSVRHGMAASAKPLTIDISARVEEGMLSLTVADDGLGLPEGAAIHEGIGLGNTRRRLNRMYGDSAVLRIESRNGVGTSIAICIPRREPPLFAPIEKVR